MARRQKAFIGKDGKFNKIVNVDGIDNEFPTYAFGRQLEDRRKLEDLLVGFDSIHVGCKGKATLATVKKWIRQNKPTQFYASWEMDSSNFKDDSVELYFKI